MKKMLAFLVAVSMCLCTFTACGDDKKEKSDAVSSSEAEPVSEEKKDEVSDEKSAESDEYADKFIELISPTVDLYTYSVANMFFVILSS